MCRYIDDDEALKTIKKMLYETALNNFTTDRKFADACEEIAEHRLATWIDAVPTADAVDVKHGEWVAYQDGKYHCSRCDDVAPKGYRWNFCPNCGADMRGEEDE